MKKPLLIIFAIFGLVLVLVGFWFAFYKKEKAAEEGLKPSQEWSCMEMPSAEVEFGEHAISLLIPQYWGTLVTWNTGERGNLVEGAFRKQNVFGGWGSGELGSATRNFSEYPYMSTIAPKGSVAANVSMSFYKIPFHDDYGRDYGFMTKQKKEAAFKPLFQIYDQRSIEGLDLEQHYIALSDQERKKFGPLGKKLNFGYWWGNGYAVNDKVAVRYYENSDSSLRGIGFFDFSTQETSYGGGYLHYKVVLINIEKGMLVEFYLPLEELEELVQFYDKENEFGFKIGLSNKDGLKREYAYLSDESNYKNTELGRFMRDMETMIISTKIVE